MTLKWVPGLDHFPMAEYTEDQMYPKTIMYTHGLIKGAQAGPIVGAGIGTFWALYKRSPIPILRGATIGLITAPAVTCAMIYGRMMSKEDIEWKDRAWRLQRNNGQLLVDRYSLLTMASAVPLAVLLRMPILQSMAIGSTVGVACYSLTASFNK